MASMANSFSYNGKKVVIDQPSKEEMRLMQKEHAGHEMHDILSIDGSNIHIMRTPDGKFSAHYFPYWSYDSLESLAKDLIDKVPEFGPHLIKKSENQ
jgi:H2-forming N5,N10-methylenetetrahydromethanopterin dehydrogenase-like enzyme